MATHSSILAWEMTWAEKPGGLQSVHKEVTRSQTQLSKCVHEHAHVNMHAHTPIQKVDS